MSAFAIFAFVLTIAYFIYYAVVIYLDLTRKDDPKNDTEDIDIPGQVANVPDDDPTQVEETEGGGYKVTSPEKETDPESDAQQKQEPTSQGGGQNAEATSVKQGVQTDKKAAPSDDSAEAVKEKLENMLNPVPVKSELEVYLEDMYPILENGGLTPAGQQISATPIRL
jgi:hypothetical protein